MGKISIIRFEDQVAVKIIEYLSDNEYSEVVIERIEVDEILKAKK